MRLVHIALPVLLAGPAAAQCVTANTGAGCGTALGGTGGGARFVKPSIITPQPFKVGDILPDDYQVLLGTKYYGLPPARDGWMYFKVENRIFRVDTATRRILEDATSEANAAF